jgi:putative hydrolase of the HAD superfamily
MTAPVVLFDLDDTIMAHREAVEAGIMLHMRRRGYEGDVTRAQRHWHELEEEHYHDYLAGRLSFEGQRRARASAFARAFGEALGDAEASAWFAEYFEDYRASWSMHGDALPMLERLTEAVPGVRLGIITNGELDYQQSKLERLGLGGRFEHVLASGSLGVTKPDAAIFEAALERFDDTPPARAVYVGDRLRTDAIGAARAGLLGVWLNRRGERPEAGDADEARTLGVREIGGLDAFVPIATEWRRGIR